jgi:subtilisin family serine protease
VVGPNHFFFGHTHNRWHGTTPPNPADAHRAIPTRPDLPGHGTRVAILDTGATNGWFPSTVSGPPDAVTEAGDGSLALDAGHGTFVTGVVLQHAPGADVVVAPVLVGNFTDEVSLVEALLALPEDIDVINLSLGGYTAGDLPPVGLQSALETLRERKPDLVVVASAGNDGWSRPSSPAALKGVIAVAALGADRHTRAAFSNFGPWVDAAAPGQDVDSSFLEWDGPIQLENGVGDGVKHDFDGWATWSGTSFAAPAVAGAIAALASTGMGASAAADRLIHGAGVRRLPGLGAILDPPVYA